MSIQFNAENQIFHIQTKNTSYIFCVAEHQTLEHLYYGKKVPDTDVKYISNRQIYAFHAHESRDSRRFSAATVGLEVSAFNSGDFRQPSLVYDYQGQLDCNRLRYVSHKTFKGRKALDGLPYCRENDETESLEITLQDETGKVELTISYVVYAMQDVIARSQTLKNIGNGEMTVQKMSSMSLDFYGMDFDVITLEGMYLYERAQISRHALKRGVFKNNSLAGVSSHNRNPFIALCSHNADEDIGEAYGFNLLYSSNFSEEVAISNLGDTRLIVGLDDTGFHWTLKAGESLTSPEAIMTYSDQGLGGMSRNFHDHIRCNIIEPKFAFAPRPIVINSWEATYFDVSEESLLALAQQALDCGIDTVVLDDAWFRKTAMHGLGDWHTDKEKFPSGLQGVSKKIHELGLNFGIWIEPEMVNADSDLYRAHPDWILSTSKLPLISRYQYILDLTRDEVVNYIADRITEELEGVEIDYIKWDFNRYATEAASFVTAQGEVYHRQMLGAYKLLDILKKRFDVLFETCSGGGGRFDLGMLYYSPQIWTSDNTDPYARSYIQYGTSMAYPLSAISCHFTVGECTTGRPSTYNFRYHVAAMGTYGYELDLSKYSAEDKAKFLEYSTKIKQNEDLTLAGDLYRLIDPETDKFCAYVKVSKDKNKAQVTFLEINATGLYETIVLRLKGLAHEKAYKNETTGEILYGSTLMNVGVRIGDLFRTNRSDGSMITFTAVE